MACALQQGYNLDCRDSVGGIKNLWMTEYNSVTAIIESNGIVTTITNAVGKRFWKYNLQKQISSAIETLAGSEDNGTVVYTQEVKIILNKQQVSVRNEILIIAQNKLLHVIEYQDGTFRLFGWKNGLFLNAGTAESGTVLGDRNGYNLTFNGFELQLAPDVNAGIIAGLEVPGV